jgi:hypothetical protein
MPVDEANEYISKIEHEENVPICLAVIGQFDKDLLEQDARQTFDQFQTWSENRIVRVRNEQLSSRRRRKETRLALNLNRLKEEGLVSDETLLMYGISGDLPEQNTYQVMNEEEKNAFWSERMETRFGPNWQDLFNDGTLRLPWFRLKESVEFNRPNWLTNGF